MFFDIRSEKQFGAMGWVFEDKDTLKQTIRLVLSLFILLRTGVSKKKHFSHTVMVWIILWLGSPLSYAIERWRAGIS